MSYTASQVVFIYNTSNAMDKNLGEPKAFYSVKNTLSEKNSYVNTLMQYDNCAVTVEGTWECTRLFLSMV